MRILFVPYGTKEAPATRYRVLQYLPHLKKRGVDFRVFSAISNLSTKRMISSPDYAPGARILYYMCISFERFCRFCYIALIAKRFDAIFLQRTTFPFRLEILLKMRNRNIVFDIDDAIYLPDTEGHDAVTRVKKYIKKREVINILKVAKAVIVENKHIEAFVSGHCKNVYTIPGPIDTERFCEVDKPDRKEVVIGWIGSPATTAYLGMLDNVLKDVKNRYDFARFRFVGLGRYANPGVDIEKVSWDYETEVKELQNFDIGIMPMPDTEWTRGKLGCKMLQYMAVGVPCVASFTPTNAEIIKNKENGFFAANDREWVSVISRLIEDRGLRGLTGEKGRKAILEKCSLSGNISKLMDIFKKVVIY